MPSPKKRLKPRRPKSNSKKFRSQSSHSAGKPESANKNSAMVSKKRKPLPKKSVKKKKTEPSRIVPDHFLTLGNPEQVKKALKGVHVQGRSEPRLIVVGRSNVGKSSLINQVLGRRLARTSSEPGKTREIHFYTWPENRMMITDLPGYGFAKVGSGTRNHWRHLIESYLLLEENALGALVLIDARHPVMPLDEEAIEFLNYHSIPVFLVFTKVDQLKTQSKRALSQKRAQEFVENWLEGGESRQKPQKTFWVSSMTGIGVKSLIQFIREESKRRA